jgi:hypothetical protein
MTKEWRWSLLLSLVFLLAACISLPTFIPQAPTPSGIDTDTKPPFFNSIPAGNGLVFIGIAGKRSNPDEALQLALEDAARRVTLFHKVSGEYAIENNVGSGAFDYTHNAYASLSFDREGYKKHVEALQFNADTDMIEIENAVIVRTVYPSALHAPVQYRPVYGKVDQKPGWVENPSFEIAGYEVGIGFSDRYSSLVDTCTNAYHNAIFAIIRNINATARTNDLLYQNTSSLFGYKTSSDNVTYSYGTLTGFYMLDMWIDPATKTVWTLAIAKKNE